MSFKDYLNEASSMVTSAQVENQMVKVFQSWNKETKYEVEEHLKELQKGAKKVLDIVKRADEAKVRQSFAKWLKKNFTKIDDDYGIPAGGDTWMEILNAIKADIYFDWEYGGMDILSGNEEEAWSLNNKFEGIAKDIAKV